MTVATCGDCGEVYTRQDGHRCDPTVRVEYLRVYLTDDEGRRIDELERLVVELRDENARWRAELGHG